MTSKIPILSTAQKRALELIKVAPLMRNNTGWITQGAGTFVPLIVIKKLRVAGLVKLSADRRSVHPV